MARISTKSRTGGKPKSKGQGPARGRGKGVKRDELVHTITQFDLAFSVIDSAVAGAILSGTHPLAIEPVLSYWFLDCAGRTRNKSEKVMKSWLTGTDFILEPILQDIADFARSFDEDIIDPSEEKELQQLLEAAAQKKPSEIELRRQNNQAMTILEWALDVLARQSDLPAVLVEMALLVEYLKVASLSADVDERIYLVVKQTIPMVQQVYENVLSGAR